MDESLPCYHKLLKLNTTSRKTIDIQEPILRWMTTDVIEVTSKHCSQVYIDNAKDEEDEKEKS